MAGPGSPPTDARLERPAPAAGHRLAVAARSSVCGPGEGRRPGTQLQPCRPKARTVFEHSLPTGSDLLTVLSFHSAQGNLAASGEQADILRAGRQGCQAKSHCTAVAVGQHGRTVIQSLDVQGSRPA